MRYSQQLTSGRWSAVVCGAVLRGLEGSIVQKKKCRRHYGHKLSLAYNRILHEGYDTTKRWVWTDKFNDEEMLTGFMFWEIGKVSLPSEMVIAVIQAPVLLIRLFMWVVGRED